MSYNINDTVNQIQDTLEYHGTKLSASYVLGTKSWIGPYSSLLLSAKQNPVGAKYILDTDISCTITESRVTKIEADRGRWELKFGRPSDANTAGKDPTDPTDPLIDTWNCNMAQYSFPLEIYLSSGADLAALDAWENENDKSLKSSYTYRDSKNNEIQLSGVVRDIAELKYGGTTDVLRFYPQATRQREYLEKIDSAIDVWPSYIDENSPAKDIYPNLSVSWLKTDASWSSRMNNDPSFDTDQIWTLTESWIGVGAENGGWNEHLYGSTERWEFHKEGNQ